MKAAERILNFDYCVLNSSASRSYLLGCLVRYLFKKDFLGSIFFCASLALKPLIFAFKFGHPLFSSVYSTQEYVFTFASVIKRFAPYIGTVMK